MTHLTRQEQKLWDFFQNNPRKKITSREICVIIDSISLHSCYTAINAGNNIIHRLRKKLPNARIESTHMNGYRYYPDANS